MNLIQKQMLIAGAILSGMAALGGLVSCSKVQLNSSPSQERSDQLQIEAFLDRQFSRCRNARFHNTTTINLGADLVTYMYIELPEEELRALLKHSAKLADWEDFKANETNLSYMRTTAAQIAGWDAEKLRNTVCGTVSWCSHYEGADCWLYGSSTVAVAPIGESWFAVYIAFHQEGMPSPEYFMNHQ